MDFVKCDRLPEVEALVFETIFPRREFRMPVAEGMAYLKDYVTGALAEQNVEPFRLHKLAFVGGTAAWASWRLAGKSNRMYINSASGSNMVWEA